MLEAIYCIILLLFFWPLVFAPFYLYHFFKKLVRLYDQLNSCTEKAIALEGSISLLRVELSNETSTLRHLKNSIQNLEQRKSLKKHQQSKTKLPYFITAFISLVLVAIYYIFNVAHGAFADKLEKSTITVNNFLSPFLLVLSVYLLYETLKTTRRELNETKDYLEKQKQKDLYLLYVEELKASSQNLANQIEHPTGAYSLDDIMLRENFMVSMTLLNEEEFKRLPPEYVEKIHPELANTFSEYNTYDFEIKNEVQIALAKHLILKKIFDPGRYSLLDFFQAKEKKGIDDPILLIENRMKIVVRDAIFKERNLYYFEVAMLRQAKQIASILKKIESLDSLDVDAWHHIHRLTSVHVSILSKISNKSPDCPFAESIKVLLSHTMTSNYMSGF
ncbi:hypothetical protein [Pseudoalteromonas luteoviolacea]|uniref:Phage abortive infection protein n=1 Tax=Pseudoalteromonas luteoviolacea S4060-1 TaxID=1365257 RepID=A0A162BQ22_9GAMM|nr:hypothetical protein [Pseudoalteromonas luteoviolacea]KZN65476.1 hypothetical protein N478_21310 [Pseudoalteromonas luteoviolacea S4060-1]